MSEQNYFPDLTWKNIRSVFRFSRKRTIVLSCNRCPEGVALRESSYISALVLLSNTIGFFLYLLLRNPINSFWNSIFPGAWSNAVKTLIPVAFEILSWVLGSLITYIIGVLVSFRLPLWIPSNARKTIWK